MKIYLNQIMILGLKRKKYKFILNFENMKRLHPKINIQTDIFSEGDEYFDSAFYQNTKESDNLNKEKGAIFLESSLTSLYLKKIYIPFRNITTISTKSKNSSKNLNISKNYLNSESSQEDDFSEGVNHQSRILHRKKSTSVIHQINETHSHEMIRQSRKLILQKINEKINESRDEREAHKSKQSEIVNKKIERLELLRKNIREQKTKSHIPTKIHEKKQVSSIPKRQNKSQMHAFIEQLQRLKQQVKEIKEVNQNILSSRVRSQVSNSNEKSPINYFQNSHEATYQVRNSKSVIKKFDPPMFYGATSPGYTKPQLLKQLGINPFPESTNSISSFRLIENEDGNKSSEKSLHNDHSSFAYSKSSGKKASVQKFDSPNIKYLPKERDPKNQNLLPNQKSHIHLENQLLSKQMVNYPENGVVYSRQPQVKFVHNPYGVGSHN